MRVEVSIVGIVQGVGFRPFVYRTATANNLRGYVRNGGDAGVEIVVEGKEKDVKHFLQDLEAKKPPLAQIYRKLVHQTGETGTFGKFVILHSSETKKLAGSVVPPDIAICSECLEELRRVGNPRFEYFFITCTNCGPRYTTISQLPYDRQNTTMKEFDMCEVCGAEYSNPEDRRFHAQTIACPRCGPQAYLATSDGQPVAKEDPIREAGRLLEEGRILAIKGYGGFHVAAATTKDEPILRLRGVKHRAQKPFAIMARNLQTVRTFAEVSPEEAETLASFRKPIVLLDKAEDYYLSDLISPGLHNIGVMLPYTGLHVMLFDLAREPAFVMTSANPPSEPIVADNQEAVRKLGSTVDYFLFHNRDIAQRCDDSVLRMHERNTSFIRRSRGYAPAPISLARKSDETILGLGAEENVTACLLSRDKAFVSQYIGDVENLETFDFLRRTVNHMIMLTNTKVEAVACDLHPKFATTRLAKEIAHREDCPVLPVQHHHAHILSLMGEHGLDEMIGIACDGYGYGLDGKPWGGEILRVTRENFSRVANLQEQPMIGGDLAARYPIRMAAGILAREADIEDWLMDTSGHFPHGKKEAQIIIDQLDSNRFSPTTSCGRILDAISAILDICFERTYQGEPAMKLESAALHGSDALKAEPETADGILNTTCIVKTVFGEKGKIPTSDLAYSAESYLARGLAQLAVDAANETETKAIGFSGGVAYNKHIALAIRRHVESHGFRFYLHEALPAGDGGISLGQAFAGAISGGHRN